MMGNTAGRLSPRAFTRLRGALRTARPGRGLPTGIAIVALLSGVTFALAAKSATPSNAAPVAAAFVQQVSAHASAKTALAVTPAANVTAGDRLVVEVGVWKAGGATTSAVD